MASLSAEEKVEFLLQVLATGEFQPNYDALAKRMAINTKSNAQRRLKGIVEADKNFILNSGKDTTSVKETITANDGDGDETGDVEKAKPLTKGQKRMKQANEKAASKRAKTSSNSEVDAKADDLTGENDDVD